MAQNNGFSLVELMIVAGLTAVVLAGLGALTLVSDVKVGRRSDSMQEAQEHWGRAVTFIQNEVADAATLSATLSNNNYPCNGIVPNPVLVLEGPQNPNNPAWTVIYGVRSRADSEAHLYRGPNLLIRCGPLPLAADLNPPNPQQTSIFGNLPNNNANPTETILLDRLAGNNPLQVLLLANANNGPVQDAQLRITMQASPVITYASDQPFRVHAQRSP
jgi:type II secretory pathway pseudopilin PulG